MDFHQISEAGDQVNHGHLLVSVRNALFSVVPVKVLVEGPYIFFRFKICLQLNCNFDLFSMLLLDVAPRPSSPIMWLPGLLRCYYNRLGF